MTTKGRTLTGTRTVSPASTPREELTFPADLIHPHQSQLARSEDAVGRRLLELDLWAQKLGEGFGISYTGFILNPFEQSVPSGASDLIATLHAFTNRDERISLERKSGKWGLYFTREAALLSNDRRTETIPLRDAPLDVRERFLIKSEAFFRGYLKLCEDRLGKMKGSVASADRTLELLNGLRLE